MKLSLQPLMTRISTSMRRPFAAACLVAVVSLAWTGWASAAACPIYPNALYPNDTFISTQSDLDTLEATGCDSVLGALNISYTADITNLDGLASLTSIEGDLIIYYNGVLTNLDGLANLTSVGGSLDLGGNEALTNLDGLANLTSVGGYLQISLNAVLTNLGGLASLTSVGGDLIIYNNGVLTNCRAIAPVLGWPNGPPEDSVRDSIIIERNAIGCNSIAEVLASNTPPTISDRFNALMQAVQATRGTGMSQQAQATSESSAGAEVVRELAKEEGATVQARGTGTTGEPESIPAMPYYLMLMMTCLVGLFGLRQLRA